MWGLALACVGCAEPPVVPKAQPLPPAKLHTVLPPRPEFRGYRLSASAFGQSSFRDGAPLHRGAIVGGLRLRTDGTGLLQAESIASPPLLEGVAVPAHLGGGFLFWNESSLFSAATFLSDLKPVIDLEFQPRAVSFGPSSLLVRGEEGQHAVLDLRARERVALADPLLVDVATLPDGRTLELLENGACKLSTDFGKTFRACGLPSGEWASRVFARQDALVAVFGDDAALRLMPGGVEQLVAKEPRPAVTGKLSWWLEQDPPLQAALEAGVPFGEEIAAVFNEGTVASVNLRTGELVQVTRALVPQKVPCELLGALDGPLLACDEPSGHEILTNLFGERPTVVAKFSQAVRLAYAEGVLIAAAHCDGSASATSVCVRGTDGTLRELDVAARLGELNRGASNGAPQASVVRWIPKEGGGALALVAGAANGWIDAESGVFQAFSYATAEAALGQPASFGWLDRAWIAPREGGLRGWRASERRGVGILPDGKLEPSAHSFRQLGAAGKYALAFDGPRRAFQSSDWGRSWVETLAPPGIGAPNIVVSDPICSDVGCQLGSWLRVGWLVEPPSSGGRVHVAGTPARPLPPPLPVLTCRERGPAVPREDAGLASPAAVGRGRRFAGEFAWAVKRPLRSSPITVGLRALVEGHVAEGAGTDAVPAKDWPGYHDTLSYSFVSPFEPKGRAERASLTWQARFVAAKAGSGEPPSLEPMVGEASSVPVLGSQLGVVSGLIVDDGAPVWLHERTAEPFTLGASRARTRSSAPSAPDRVRCACSHSKARRHKSSRSTPGSRAACLRCRRSPSSSRPKIRTRSRSAHAESSPCCARARAPRRRPRASRWC